MVKKHYSFIFPKLKEHNLSLDDYELITHPFDYAFEFKKGEGCVRVDSAYEVLPEAAQRELRAFLNQVYCVEKGSCHKTAVEVGLLLEKYGVEVVDGYYKLIDDDITYRHSFCKYNERYFDPTIEEYYGFKKTKGFSYISERVFSPHEIRVFQFACAYLETKQPLQKVFVCSTLGENKYSPERTPEYMIDNEGFLQCTAA